VCLLPVTCGTVTLHGIRFGECTSDGVVLADGLDTGAILIHQKMYIVVVRCVSVDVCHDCHVRIERRGDSLEVVHLSLKGSGPGLAVHSKDDRTPIVGAGLKSESYQSGVTKEWHGEGLGDSLSGV